MRILLDECVPRRLRRALVGHEVRTAAELGWNSLKNGLLLQAAASDKFDVFLTTDQRLDQQQNVRKFSIRVVVLVARRNKLEFLLPLVPEALNSFAEIKPGEVRRITERP